MFLVQEQILNRSRYYEGEGLSRWSISVTMMKPGLSSVPPVCMVGHSKEVIRFRFKLVPHNEAMQCILLISINTKAIIIMLRPSLTQTLLVPFLGTWVASLTLWRYLSKVVQSGTLGGQSLYVAGNYLYFYCQRLIRKTFGLNRKKS